MGEAKEGSDSSTERNTAREWLGIYLKGVAMGAADTVPGVSGGTIALITGIYERLVTAIAAFEVGLALDILGAGNRSRSLPLNRAAERIDLAFLVVLGFGIGTAILIVSRVVALGLAEFRAPTNAFFFGLIAASAIVLYREVTLDTPHQWVAAIFSAGFAFWLTGFTAAGGVPPRLSVILVAGIITSSAMLLPGISGAALLYILGQYEFMVDALHQFMASLVDVLRGEPISTAVADGMVVTTFLIGVAIGLVTIARVVRWALRSDRGTTLTVLVSLMIGALRLPAAEVASAVGRWNPAYAGVVLASALIGATVVLLLDRYTSGLDYDV